MTSAADATAKWEVQVRKGVLELVVLLTVQARETYGYELITTIAQVMDFNLTEGTIYPLLNRLHKEGLLTARWVDVEGSVPRKYYKVSQRGSTAVETMESSWLRLTRGVQRLSSRRQAGAAARTGGTR